VQAIVFTKYGPPEQLKLREVPKPVPKEDEVLIKIHATAINDWDWSLVRGEPYIYRLLFGILKPKNHIPGIELSGTIVAVGSNVSTFKEGDEVYGDISEYGWGSFAEYISINEKSMTLKPTKMTFEEAAAIPHAAMLAYQGLIELGNIQKGQKVLINGAGGGVGTLGIQIARQYDSEVTGVDTGDKLKMMESVGFDHIIDYKEQDFTKSGLKYDLILDAKTTRSPAAYARTLNPAGKYVTVGGNLPRIVQLLISRKLGRKNMFMVAIRQNKDLAYINQLYEEGKFKPVIDGPYKLSETPGLFRYFGEGKHKGKVIITP